MLCASAKKKTCCANAQCTPSDKKKTKERYPSKWPFGQMSYVKSTWAFRRFQMTRTDPIEKKCFGHIFALKMIPLKTGLIRRKGYLGV